MKVSVDEGLCIGCGSCVAIDDTTFAFGDDGYAEAIKDEITDAVINAAESCPTDAINIKE